MRDQAPIRVGVVGIGFGQHVHVPAFRRDLRVRVDAICASTVERASAVAQRSSIPCARGEWRAMVDDPDLDALALSVPPHLQAEIALATVQAGKHLFAEKPLATCIAEAKAIVDTAAATGSSAAVDFEFRVIPAWLKAREIIESGAARARTPSLHQLAPRDIRLSTNQSTWKREAAGGVLNLFVSHTFDSVEWLFGPVRRLAAHLEPATGADARAEVWLELVDGPNVSISAAADLPGGSGHRVEIYGDDGALFLENVSNDYINGFTLSDWCRERGKPRPSSYRRCQPGRTDACRPSPKSCDASSMRSKLAGR